jgi:DNA-binding transcriptional ArsR family regulator
LQSYLCAVDRDSTIVPTPRQLRALTHPVRLRMLGILRMEGPKTATSLAQRLGLNTGATSYHLRQLADHGFIEDDAERGTGRERWWRARYTSTRLEKPMPDAAEDVDAYLQAVAVVFTEQLQRAMEERALLPEPWRRASTFSDWQVRLSPGRAREVVDTLDRLLSGIEDEDEDGAATFTINVNAFPRPGALTLDTAEERP